MICVNENTCVGCEACVNICPENCIKMVQNREGFYYPVVESSLCIDCGMCERVCIAEQQGVKNKAFLKCYAAISKNDDERMMSSSGGVFSVLANCVLSKGGTVYGAAFDDKLTVHHIRVDNQQQLGKLRGSKYVQSHIDDAFSLAEKDLKDGKYVLFTGTGCQIDALKLYLQKDYDTLYAVAIDCHDVPSEMVWLRYLKSKGVHSLPINFRNKEKGWNGYYVEFGNRYKVKYQYDPYMKLFLSSIMSRKSCAACPSKGIERGSDLTIGDFWWIQQIDASMFDDKGTSIVLVHTRKGAALLEEVNDALIVKEESVEDAVKNKASLVCANKPPETRAAFFEKLNKEATPDFNRLYNQLCVYYGKTTKEKIIIAAKRCVKRIINY